MSTEQRTTTVKLGYKDSMARGYSQLSMSLVGIGNTTVNVVLRFMIINKL